MSRLHAWFVFTCILCKDGGPKWSAVLDVEYLVLGVCTVHNFVEGLSQKENFRNKLTRLFLAHVEIQTRC